jgi:hypothetical protein
MNGDALVWINAPHFCAGVAYVRGAAHPRVTDAAPIVRYMRGWTVARVLDYCASKRWQCVRVRVPG